VGRETSTSKRVWGSWGGDGLKQPKWPEGGLPDVLGSVHGTLSGPEHSSAEPFMAMTLGAPGVTGSKLPPQRQGSQIPEKLPRPEGWDNRTPRSLYVASGSFYRTANFSW
jgi:hypothetical protein